MIRRMLKEEWRMHSRLFSGRSFALFPVMIFLLTLLFTYATVKYSTVSLGNLGMGLAVFGGFMGASVGSIAFTSRSAMKNILGPTNLLIYSSRTLPLSDSSLLLAFLVKDLVYYTFLFLLPVSLGVLLPTGFSLVPAILQMGLWFFAGLVISVAVARSSLRVPGVLSPRYSTRYLSPLADKSVLDLSRSAGGIFKVFFTLAILTGFYWFLVLYFPAASLFLNNPLLSYSVLVGTLALSVYNWLNRFDALENYLYLPLDGESLLSAKQHAYLAVAVPVSLLYVAGSYFFYPSLPFLAVATSIATVIYTMGIASYLTGTEPNERLYDTGLFLKYLAANSVFVVPLLVLSVIYTEELLPVYLGFVVLAAVTGFVAARKSLSY